MVRRATYLVAVLLAAACAGRGGDAGTDGAAPTRSGQSVVITDSLLVAGGADTVRFGRMNEGEIAVRQLWIENRASKPVVILDYDRTCGCTTLDFDTRPIREGEAQRMTVTFDTRGEWGWQMKRVDVKLAGTAEPFRLFVEADIE